MNEYIYIYIHIRTFHEAFGIPDQITATENK